MANVEQDPAACFHETELVTEDVSRLDKAPIPKHGAFSATSSPSRYRMRQVWFASDIDACVA